MSKNLEGITLADQYSLKKLIYVGGMAQVYQAWDQHRSAYMSIKIIHDINFFDSFFRESKALKKITHPNIIRFYDVGVNDNMGIMFLVSDWVDGKDLQRVIEKRDYLSVGEVAHVFEYIQKALNYSHKLGVCHCDIKPRNIIVRDSDGQVFLSDLGLAHVTNDRFSGGTLPFIAPELFSPDGKYSISSDIYALGITLYQLLSGRLPFYGETKEQIIQEHKNRMPPPIQRFNSNIPNGIVSVIEKSLAKDPNLRQKSATEMYVEFSQHVTERFNHKSMSRYPFETPPKSRLFISYSSADSETVNILSKLLQKAGFDIWLDQKDIVIGQPILDRIRDGVTKESDYVLIILSKHSTISEWCKLELRMAYEKEMTAKRIVVLPIRIDEAEVPDEVKTKKYFQLEITEKNSVSSLISQIKSLEKM